MLHVRVDFDVDPVCDEDFFDSAVVESVTLNVSTVGKTTYAGEDNPVVQAMQCFLDWYLDKHDDWIWEELPE